MAWMTDRVYDVYARYAVYLPLISR
jgi:hypothetical protein